MYIVGCRFLIVVGLCLVGVGLTCFGGGGGGTDGEIELFALSSG